MSRKNKAPVRSILADPIYNSVVVAKLINTIMLDGKKSTSQAILYNAFEKIQKKTGKEPMEILNKALENIAPQLEIKTRRIGGANYQVPVETTQRRKDTLVLRWLVAYSRARAEHTMEDRLANEIIDASNGVGASVKKRDDTHKMAEANRAFAHYRW